MEKQQLCFSLRLLGSLWTVSIYSDQKGCRAGPVVLQWPQVWMFWRSSVAGFLCSPRFEYQHVACMVSTTTKRCQRHIAEQRAAMRKKSWLVQRRSASCIIYSVKPDWLYFDPLCFRFVSRGHSIAVKVKSLKIDEQRRDMEPDTQIHLYNSNGNVYNSKWGRETGRHKTNFRVQT